MSKSPWIIVILVFIALILSSGCTKSNTTQSETNQPKTSYYEKIIIRNIKAYESPITGTVVDGEVKNTGDKTLKKVELTIYFLDINGNAVSETKYNPVNFYEGVWVGDRTTEPLKANYSTRLYAYDLSPPSDWAGKVDIKITNIEFMEK
jgi:hypothetical protein